ncbi:hypothetical protein CDAR_189961 [Caerostris darwini]|uniref:Uncharacterized protein n=1 Tax=Caerostris darwini TaxID=1538125 RepID=A0AAV4QRF7_9ARAC|nr:hypothetical protein CDAR_189961 [Caerostris darwini]
MALLTRESGSRSFHWMVGSDALLLLLNVQCGRRRYRDATPSEFSFSTEHLTALPTLRASPVESHYLQLLMTLLTQKAEAVPSTGWFVLMLSCFFLMCSVAEGGIVMLLRQNIIRVKRRADFYGEDK